MVKNSIWITGSTRSGKTTALASKFQEWVAQGLIKSSHPRSLAPLGRRRVVTPPILILAANDDNRRDLAQKLTMTIQGRYPIIAKTPLGFFQDEVMLFWPLLIRRLNLRAQFPLRLRPETEQELATELWLADLERCPSQLPGANDYLKVRRLLDLLQLAAIGGTPIEDIPAILQQGILEAETEETANWEIVGEMLTYWRQWCLERGLLTYGIICELYWRELLVDATYQEHLKQRYRAVLADDVDDYPAIARDLLEYLLDQGAIGAFSYNPDSKVRLGLNADPNYLAGLASRCQIERLATPEGNSLSEIKQAVVELITDPMLFTRLPPSVQSIQATSRATLLQQTAQVIVEAVKSGTVQPQEITIIAPGLDAIARYTLTDIFTSQGIPVEPLNDQRPLISSPMIQALLTLLALVYPGLGRLVDRDAVAQMLVVLSQKQDTPSNPDTQENTILLTPHIDPVRAGLLADYCYAPDIEQPRLLPVESFPRWDRLGHRATTAYLDIIQWLEQQRSQQQQRLLSSCIVVLDRAIQKFLWNGSNLPYDQLSALRELMETAQHYWEVDGRLRQITRAGTPTHTTVGQFIQLLRRGTVTANPYPVHRLNPTANVGVTLATIFQYRASRRSHRWQFWLDAGSPLWNKGGAAALFGANLFLKDWSGRPTTDEDQINADAQRLERILRDLLGRAGERVYLCHSDLAVNGTEQAGPLLTLVNACAPLTEEGKTPLLSPFLPC